MSWLDSHWPPQRRGYLLVLATAHFLMISAVSHVPGATLMATGIHVWDKVAHLSEYIPLGYLLCLWGIGSDRRRVSNKKSVLVAALLVLVLGAIDELHQSAVPGRTMSVRDLLADTLGGLGGATIAVWMHAARKTSRKLNSND